MKLEVFKSPFNKVAYSLVIDTAIYKEACEAHGLTANRQVDDDDYDGCTVTHNDGDRCHCIVVLPVSKSDDKNHALGVLVHESVHIYQEFRDRILESNPSPEFEAYTIQEIFYNLLTELNKYNSPQ